MYDFIKQRCLNIHLVLEFYTFFKLVFFFTCVCIINRDEINTSLIDGTQIRISS